MTKEFVTGFIKRAAQHGIKTKEAIAMLKQAEPGLVSRLGDAWHTMENNVYNNVAPYAGQETHTGLANSFLGAGKSVVQNLGVLGKALLPTAQTACQPAMIPSPLPTIPVK